MTVWLGFLALLLLTTPARADIGLPPGFTSEVYVTGQGFDTSGERGVSGIPSVGTLGLDAAGTLYMSRTGARFRVGDVEDLSAIYRIPVGGARLTPDNEKRYLYGPPLPNPQIGAVAARGPVWVTTYDRERRLGALYRFLDGKPVLFAGGRPAPGAEPVLRHPEGVVIDSTGDLYVTDREEGAIVRLDARGNLVNRRHATVLRPRILTMDEAGNLWVGATARPRRRSARAAARFCASRPMVACSPCSRAPCRPASRRARAGRCSWFSGGRDRSSRSRRTAAASTSPPPATAASSGASRSSRSRRRPARQGSRAISSSSSSRAPCGCSTR